MADARADKRSPLFLVGLYRDSAIVELNGKIIHLTSLRPTIEGVTLIRASSEYALIQHEGKVQRYSHSDLGGGVYITGGAPNVVVYENLQGLYITQGYIENIPVLLRIDPEAEALIISASHAKELALNYQERGQPIQVVSKLGVQKAHSVMLESVSVGDLELKQVGIVVIEGALPTDIIVGQSFLNRVSHRYSGGVLYLTQSR